MTDVVVAGGGVAALEFVLALRAHTGTGMHVTVIAPEPEFSLRPQLVAAPLGAVAPVRIPLAELASDIGFGLVPASIASVDVARGRVLVRSGDAVPYETLVLALGARTLPALEDALHLGDADAALGLAELHEDIRRGAVRSVAFVAPSMTGWLTALYEAALLTANAGHDVAVSLVTPEAGPLQHFGPEASAAVAHALDEAGIVFRADLPVADRVVTVPLLRGPRIDGVPVTGPYGLIGVDGRSRVLAVPDLYAIGDATDFPIKQAAVACWQADVAAADIAVRNGFTVSHDAPDRVPRATLMTGRGAPLELNGGQGPDKLPGRHLARYLALTRA